MHASLRDGGIPRIILIGALLWLMLLATTLPARGQGMMGLLPEPISTSDLMDYSRLLSLSDAQWQAVEKLHDEYKRDYRGLNDRAMKELTEQMNVAGSEQSLESVEKLLDRRAEWKTKVASYDRRLFDQMLGLLSEAQAERMPRVRMRRQRDRYSDQFMRMIIGQQAIDLSELVRDLDLPEPLLIELDPLLLPYERMLTGRLRELDDMSRQVLLDYVRLTFDIQVRQEDAARRLAEAEATGEEEGDDEVADREIADEVELDSNEMLQDMQAALGEASRESREKYGKLREYNRQYLRRLETVLPEDTSRELLIAFYRDAYPNLGYSFLQTNKLAAVARQIEDLTSEQADAIDELVDGYYTRLIPMIERMARAYDEAGLEQMNFGFDQQRWQEYEEQTAETRMQLQQSSRTLFDQVKELVGSDPTRRLFEAAGENWLWLIDQKERAAMAPKAEDASPEALDADRETAETSWDHSSFVPPRLSVTEFETYADRLDLDDAGRSVLQTLHEDYRIGYRALREELDEAGQTMQTKLWTFDEQSGEMTQANPETIDRLEQIRRQAHEALTQMEDALFSNIELVVLATADQRRQLERIRRVRQCQLYGHGQNQSYGFGFQTGRGINVSGLVYERLASESLSDELDELLRDYDRELLAMLRRRFDLDLKMQSNQLRFTVESMRFRQSGNYDSEEYRELMRTYITDPMQRQRTIESSIVDLNESLLVQLDARLPEDEVTELRHVIRVRSNPGIYEDPLAVQDQLDRARKLDDLSRESLAALDQLTLDYRIEYETISRRMVESSRSISAFNIMTMQDDKDAEERMKRYMELQQSIESDRFERRELNIRIIRKLTSLLSPDQLRRIGSLPDPAEHESSPY